MTTATYLNDVAENILASALSALAQARTGNPIPKRSYVAWGEPVPDSCCEFNGQLTVHLSPRDLPEGAISIDPSPGRQMTTIIPRAAFAVTLFRCVPNLENGLPEAKELSASARRLQMDLWALFKGLADDINDGSLYTGASCDSTQIVRVEPLDPDGGCAGLQIALVILANSPLPE